MRNVQDPDLKSLRRQHQRRYTVAEAARCLDVHNSTVRRMCNRGELDGVKVGRAWRIDPTSLREALQHGTEDLL